MVLPGHPSSAFRSPVASAVPPESSPKFRIKLLAGDKVPGSRSSPYDLTRGRITLTANARGTDRPPRAATDRWPPGAG